VKELENIAPITTVEGIIKPSLCILQILVSLPVDSLIGREIDGGVISLIHRRTRLNSDISQFTHFLFNNKINVFIRYDFQKDCLRPSFFFVLTNRHPLKHMMRTLNFLMSF